MKESYKLVNTYPPPFRNQGEGCSTDCLGDSCESVYSFAGGCFVPSLLTSSDCSLFSSENDIPTEWYKDELCVLSTVLSEVGCGEVDFFFFFFGYFSIYFDESLLNFVFNQHSTLQRNGRLANRMNSMCAPGALSNNNIWDAMFQNGMNAQMRFHNLTSFLPFFVLFSMHLKFII